MLTLKVIFIRCEITITGGLSSVSKVGCAKITFSKEREQDLIDLNFVDDNLIMLILADQGRPFHMYGNGWLNI